MASNNFEGLGRFPYMKVSPRDPTAALAQVFRFHDELDFMLYNSPWLHLPPASMDNEFAGLAVFMVPRSLLDTDIKMFLIFKDTTRPGDSAMPDEIYGTTKVLDAALRASLKAPNHAPTSAVVAM